METAMATRVMSRRRPVAIVLAVLGVAAAIAAYGWYGTSGVAPGAPRLASTTLPRVLPRPYQAEAPARDDVERAFERAAKSGRRVIVNQGANWCPDCLALAGMFSLPEFKTFVADNYEHVYVDVNRLNRNMDVVKSLGISELEGIPTVLIFSPKRELLNRTTSEEWTDASTRNAQQAMNYFASWAKGSR